MVVETLERTLKSYFVEPVLYSGGSQGAKRFRVEKMSNRNYMPGKSGSSISQV